MAKKTKSTPKRVCGDCIHQIACFYAGGGCGNNDYTDATSCANFDTLASYIGRFAEIMGYKKIDNTCGNCNQWVQDIRGCTENNVGQCAAAKWIVGTNGFCIFWEG